MKTNLPPLEVAARWFVLVLALAFVVFFLIDGFLLHTIPAPEGFFELRGEAPLFYFRLEDVNSSDTPYADARVLDRVGGTFTKIYLVEQDGIYHLLEYRTHMVTLRSGLKRDIIIDPTQDQTYELGWLYTQVRIHVQNGVFADDTLVFEMQNAIYPFIFIAYFFLAALVAIIPATLVYRRRVKSA